MSRATPPPDTSAPYDVDPFFDEAYDDSRRPREHYRALLEELAGCDVDALARAVCDAALARGLEFVGPAGVSTPFTVDPVPRMITAEEWRQLEAGLAQRARALHAFLVDAYGDQAIVSAGVMPARAVSDAPGYEPDLLGAPRAIADSPLMVGFDVVRGRDGRFTVLEDNVRTPSGSGYAAAIGEIVSDCLPEAGGVSRRDLQAAWRAWLEFALCAAPRASDGAIVLLSDGATNSAWFEHQAIARLLGLPIVTLDDLETRDTELFAWIDGSRTRIDTLYRRTDDSRLRHDRDRLTALGAGLLSPWRDGRLLCVNGFGTGVADDKLVHAHVDEMVGFYLGEVPILSSVPTHDLADTQVLDAARDRLSELVVKPRFGHGGRGVVVCAHASPDELAALERALEAAPEHYVAQDLVELSRHPTVSEGTLRPRHVDLRVFAVCREGECSVLPGGLTRYARAPGSLVVNSSQGGGAKDTWVLT